ncbi:L-rhamnose mutarotase [Streptomyces ipomoeae]|uniref:L-rhamnose mutarotase n=1 Tax=Streptomyces ipomoeae TaxID=103232 RepID=UPI001147387D|nr:L-rhamnose mutarotase [Streptomyces ipomoeae]MDX2935506.1 L-rhamnose mutarotase [Streptomyces ipomoeae]TQE18340.1 L-rhamnose mutarotase [Streptomyces ipomoeae]
MRIAPHTKVRAAGASEWTILRWGSPRASTVERGGGTDLFHVLDAEDYPAMIAEPEKLPATIARQARMAELLDVVHDYSAEGADASLPVVWQL